MSFRANRLGASALVAAALCIGTLLGSVLTAGPLHVSGQSGADQQTTLLQQIYQKINPSVFSITVGVPPGIENPDLFPTGIPGATGPDALVEAEGSGFLYDNQGYIITNAHVVQDAKQIVVTMANGTSLVATLSGVDPDSDLAVIKIDPRGLTLSAPALGDSDKLTIGERTITIGSPFGYSGSLSQGIVSGLNRAVSGLKTSTGQARFLVPQAIQTDAAVNPGSTGGPLINSQGEVVGVVTSIASSTHESSGVNFAIPSNIVKKVADALIKDGKIDHSYLGIFGGSLTLQVNQLLGLDANFRGVLVREVAPGSPAATAGIKPGDTDKTLNGAPIKVGGDIIVTVDTTPVRSFDDLLSYLFLKTAPGQTITLTVNRGGQKIPVKVTLTKRPQ